MITVMLLAYNEQENIKRAIQSFRLFCDMDISLVVIDNGSTDALSDWMKEQEDVTYVYMDEGHMGWGKAINMVMRELQIDTDLLIMKGNCMLTPKSLPRMMELLYKDEDTGAVGGMFNESKCKQRKDFHSYGEAVKKADREETAKGKRVIILDEGAILWKKKALNEIGQFEERLDSIYAVTLDYCLRMGMEDKKLTVCSNAFLWKLPTQNGDGGCRWEIDVMDEKWGIHYVGNYSASLSEQIEAEKDDKISVLEIGCATGGTLLEIKNRYPLAEVYGTEINVQSAAFAAHFAKVAVNNIEEKKLPFDKNMFDYIIFGDVLEHLHNPLEILEYCKDFLREGGHIIASIPNVMHISVMEQLLRGDFTYTEYGLLDKTHIHLFTYNEIVRMFHEAGYEIDKIGGNHISISDRQKQLIDALLLIENKAEKFMYETFQYIVDAKMITDKKGNGADAAI